MEQNCRINGLFCFYCICWNEVEIGKYMCIYVYTYNCHPVILRIQEVRFKYDTLCILHVVFSVGYWFIRWTMIIRLLQNGSNVCK